MFYPPEGCRLLRGPFVLNLCLIGVGNSSGGFKLTNGDRPFSNLENVLSPGLQRVQLILFSFIGIGNEFGGFKLTGGDRPF